MFGIRRWAFSSCYTSNLEANAERPTPNVQCRMRTASPPKEFRNFTLPSILDVRYSTLGVFFLLYQQFGSKRRTPNAERPMPNEDGLSAKRVSKFHSAFDIGCSVFDVGRFLPAIPAIWKQTPNAQRRTSNAE